jgi:hypothetical protein
MEEKEEEFDDNNDAAAEISLLDVEGTEVGNTQRLFDDDDDNSSSPPSAACSPPRALLNVVELSDGRANGRVLPLLEGGGSGATTEEVEEVDKNEEDTILAPFFFALSTY